MEGLGWLSRIRVVGRIGKALPTLPHSVAICGGLPGSFQNWPRSPRYRVQIAPYLLATSEEAWGLPSLTTEGKP
jgi:hypothetical protein